LTRKCFPLTNFSNDKQIQESLENSLPKITFQKTNAPLRAENRDKRRRIVHNEGRTQKP
jgi:hypothetical protein